MDYKEKVIALLNDQELSKEQKEKLENIFPELKESENEDEKIRKGLIKAVSRIFEGHKLYDTDVTREEALAWLEKQDEQKPTDNVEPKFKVGNWYQCTKDFFTFDKNTAYYCAKDGFLQNEYGCYIAIIKDLYDNFKLWTIEDAKWADAHPDIDVRTMAAWQSGYKEAIDKACEWLSAELDKEEERHYIHVHGFDKERREIFLEDFRKAMKGGEK